MPDSLSVDTMSFDVHDTAYSAFVGIQTLQYFGLEAGYWNHGTFESRTTSTDTGRLSIEELYVGATLRYPIADRFALTGGIGISRARFVVRGSGTVRLESNPGIPPILPLPVELPDAVNVAYSMPKDESGHYWNVGLNMRLTNSLEASLSYGTRDLQVVTIKLPALSLLYAL